jgi:hypothetical protein
MRNVLKITLLAATVLIGLIQSSGATVIGITSRGALGANDSIDWGQLGPAGTIGTIVSNPTTVTSANALSIGVSMPAGSFQRFDQGGNWNGNFAPGDKLLYTKINPGPLTLSFLTGISGGGAQIQESVFGAFTAEISAFDVNDVLLGTFSENGVSDSNGNNSAIFIGLLSSAADIYKLAFDITAFNVRDDFAINLVSLATTPSTAVPEPGTWSVMLLGLAGIGFAAYRRRRTAPVSLASA